MITVIPRKIAATSVNGVAVSNNGNVALPTDAAFGTCASAAGEQNKVVVISDSNWQLKVGSIVGVRFSNTNTYSATAENPCTLNVNGSGAKAVYYNAGVYTGNHSNILGYKNRTNFYMYDGTYWVWLNMSCYTSTTYTSAYCTTKASTAAKVASCSNFTLAANSYVHILIQYANTYNGAITLNIDGTGEKPIYINGSASSSSNKTLPAGTYIIYYDGTNYYFRTDGMLPGNIEKVNGHTVEKDVPSGAIFTDFTGATASTAGTHGYVPAPAAGDQGKFLKGDGSWDNVPVMDGASSVSAGASGLVPAPAAADYNKVLKGNGAWATIPETANEMPMSSSDNTTVKEAIDKLGQFTSISGSTKTSIQNNLVTFASNLTDGSITAIKFSVGSSPDAPFESTTYVGTLYKAGTRLFVRVQGITKISQDLNGYYREGYAWVWNSFNSGISEINNSLGIVEDGDTAVNNIAAGQFVMWKGVLSVASTAIASGTTLSSSNLVTVPNGGFNNIVYSATEPSSPTVGMIWLKPKS